MAKLSREIIEKIRILSKKESKYNIKSKKKWQNNCKGNTKTMFSGTSIKKEIKMRKKFTNTFVTNKKNLLQGNQKNSEACRKKNRMTIDDIGKYEMRIWKEL